MSTLIYHGYRILTEDGGRPDVFALTAQLRSTLQPLYLAGYATELVRRAALAVDAATVPALPGHMRQQEAMPYRPIGAADTELGDAWRTINDGTRVPDADFHCEVAFLPDPGDPDGPLYALLYTEREDYTTAFAALPGVEPWGYWNDTDAHDGVTAEQWEHRRQVWDRILGRDAPATRGLTWKLLGKYPTVGPKTVRAQAAAALPDRPTRARALAQHRIPLVDQDLRLRRMADYRADVDAEALRIEPLLRDLTIEQLYGEAPLAA